MRYRVISSSESGHCCFEATVVDTVENDEFGQDKTMCECFDIVEARKIAEALNNYGKEQH